MHLRQMNKEQLAVKDAAYQKDVSRLLENMRKAGYTEEEIDQTLYFVGGDLPSNCAEGSCNCAMH